ncbi:MAG: putative ADP-ribose pyrophosphatase [Chloroflexi bacterium]|jgi:ADP-ribose pyrophosphatase|nr:putative ADP-ribose pyrophosphatase [Chloroflexota bacterium]
MTFEIIDQEMVYKGKAFDVRREKIRTPQGAIVLLDIVDHRGAVTMIPVDQEGRIIFVRQYRHPAGKFLLELPAGVMEVGELPENSAQREVREETGMAAEKLVKVGEFYLAPGYSTEYMHVFLATQLYPAPLPGDIDEVLSLERVPIREAYRLAMEGEIQDAKSLAALFLARQLLE